MESTTLLIRHAFIAWIIASFNVVSFAFFFLSFSLSFFLSFFPQIAPFNQITLFIWLITCGPALTAWRVVLR
ncbi:MAG: hypothetical protein ACI96W_003962 [Paraglaciecola sp.]|jgi:hypothetical protein